MRELGTHGGVGKADQGAQRETDQCKTTDTQKLDQFVNLLDKVFDTAWTRTVFGLPVPEQVKGNQAEIRNKPIQPGMPEVLIQPYPMHQQNCRGIPGTFDVVVGSALMNLNRVLQEIVYGAFHPIISQWTKPENLSNCRNDEMGNIIDPFSQNLENRSPKSQN